MIHLFKSALARTFTYALVAVLVAGLLLGALRLVLPFAGTLRGQVETLVGEQLGLPVRLGDLEVRLRGWRPQLRFRDARFLDQASGQVQLAMDRLALDLDLGASLQSLKPQIGAVTLVGARLVVRRLADGRLLVGGIQGTTGDPPDLAFFLRQGTFRLEAGEITWMEDGGTAPPLVLSGVRAWFVNAGPSHRLAVRATALNGVEVGLRLVADLIGEADAPGLWDGRAYLSVSGADLAPLVRTPLPADLRLSSDGVRLAAWAQIAAGRLAEVQAHLDLAGLALRRTLPGLEAQPLRLQALGTSLDWRQLPGAGGWRLDLHDLRVVQQRSPWPITDLALLQSSRDDGAWELRGGLSQARLGQILDLAQGAAPTLRELLPLESQDAFDHLLEADPDAAIRGLTWRLSGGGTGAPTWALGARLDSLNSTAAGALPGVRGLDLELVADQGGGQATLSGSGPGGTTVLDLPGLLREPLQLKRLKGELTWRQEADGRLWIQVPELIADHAAVATQTTLSLCLPASGGSPFLDLRGHFGNGDAVKAKALIPVGVLTPTLVQWIDQAVLAGQVPSGAVLFRGKLGDFPFREQEGRLLVLFDVRGGTLQYLPDWPALTAIDGQVQFLNHTMDLVVERARVLVSDVTGGTAGIDDLFRTRTLTIHASATGPQGDGLRVLRETPLAGHLGRLAEAFEVHGDMVLDLDISTQLHPGQPMTLAGRIGWPEGARIGLKGSPVELHDPAGSLAFTTEGLTSEGLTASLWGSPIRLAVESLGSTPAERRTRVRAGAATAVATLAKHLPSPAWSQLDGTLDWDLAVELRNADVSSAAIPIGFELDSDLKRLALGLPAPLGKTAGTKRPLSLTGRFTPGVGVTADAKLGDLTAHMDFAPQADGALELSGGRITVGAEPTGSEVRPANADGLWLTGSLANLDGDAWQDWWAGPAKKLAGPTTKSARDPGVLRGADLQIGRLSLGGVNWDDLRLRLKRGKGSWEADLAGASVAGTLSLPDDPRSQPIRARLTRLDLAPLANNVEETQIAPKGPAESSPADPRLAPGLDLQIEQLNWGKLELGRLKVLARPQTDGLDIPELSLQGPLAQATGSGAWTQVADGVVPVTRLALQGDSADLGALLRGLGYASAVEHAPATVGLSADWTGAPTNFDLAGLTGQLTFEVEAGSLLAVEPGVGRMLGILNIGALQRRLTLDFSDVFDKGYRFESISGDIALTPGLARIEHFEIAGPAADIAVTGSADLKTRRLDQVATVTPKISTGVAVASAVVGGPLVGAAVYLVDRVTGGAIDNLGRYQYRIEGPWDAPQVTPQGSAAAMGSGRPSSSTQSELGLPTDPGTAESAPRPKAPPAPTPEASPNPFLH